MQWIQQVAVAHWDSAANPAHKDAYFWVVVRHEIDYLRPAFEGDRITARTWIDPEIQGARTSGTWNFQVLTASCWSARAPSGRSSTRLRAGRSASLARWWRHSCRKGREARMSRAVLYDYFRSSAAYRVRIALNLKGVDYEQRDVNLAEGDHKSAEYRALNPQGLVPMLEIDGHRLTQSLSIIIYLDQTIARAPADAARSRRRRACPRHGDDHRLRHPPSQQPPSAQISQGAAIAFG